MPKRLLSPPDLLHFHMADDPQISPDGAWIAWVRTWMDGDLNGYRSSIWVTDVDTGSMRSLTDGSALDTHPRPSPDGAWIAFLRVAPDQGLPTPQLCFVRAQGGAILVGTQLRHGVSDIAWSPDGTRIIFTTRMLPGEDFPLLETAQPSADPYVRFNEDVLVTSRRKWKMDGAGFLGEERRAVAMVAVTDGAAGEPVLVAGGNYDLTAPVWSPDGTQIAAVGNLNPDADAVRRLYIYVIGIERGIERGLSGSKRIFPEEIRQNPPNPRSIFGLEDIRHPGLAWSPDGTQIAVAGHNDATLGHYGSQQLWIVDVASGAGHCVTQGFDRTLGMAAATDMARYGGDMGLCWLPDGDQIVALVSDAGTVHPCAIAVADGTVTPLTAGDSVAAAYSLDAAAQRMAILVRDESTPGDIFVADLTGPRPGAMKRITDVNAWVRDEIDMPKAERFTFRGHADLSIDGWILRPPQLAPGEKAPLIYFHGGGPGGMRGGNVMFEYQVLAGAGYAVAWCNAHGCQGYGEEFCTAILGDWGGADFEDILACVDAACAQFDFVDSERLGIAGGSYGGYHVNWALGHTDRFRAAVSDRSVFNRTATWGTSDIGPGREFEFGGGPPWETTDWYLKQSPISYLAGAKTPTLVVHSARDYRCPIEQGEALYLSLQFLGVPTELVRFPDEGHELSRSGKPWHRVFRLEKYLDWFGKWLEK